MIAFRTVTHCLGMALAALCVSLAFVPVVANARVIGPNSSPQVEFDLTGSKGYSVSVGTYGRQVTLQADGLAGIAVYTVRGTVSARNLEARFGKLGRISVEFKPSGGFTRSVPPRQCKGGPRIRRLGVFVGTIRFRGEGGYTEVDAVRVRGSVHIHRRWRCKSQRRPRPNQCKEDDRKVESVQLSAYGGGRRPGFDVYSERFPEEAGTTMFSAISVERREGMAISRFAFISGPERAFVYDEGLLTATVSPPPPFEGTATFQRDGDRSTSWKGDLRVSLPGAPDMPLAGSAFEAHLLRPDVERSSGCSFTVIAVAG